MAIACLRLFTVFPLLPLLSLPRLNPCISRSTLFCALGPYFLPRLDFFFDELRERDELRCERLEDLLPLLMREREALDFFRDELFLRAVAIRTSLLRY